MAEMSSLTFVGVIHLRGRIPRLRPAAAPVHKMRYSVQF